jgi:DNA-binding NarL/FixJ family response regulator
VTAEAEEPIRVLLVEDSDVYRDSLAYLLGRVDGVTVAGAVGDGRSAAPSCAAVDADVVVLDFRLPDLDGSEVAEDVRERCPEAAVVFLSASAGRAEREAARSAGIALVRKDEGLDTLVGAIRAAAGRSSA